MILGGVVESLAERTLLTLNLSKTQIDRLGDRLRKSTVLRIYPPADDIKLLDEYRRSFGEAYEHVVRTIREQLRLEPTGRPAKSTTSIVEKLHRETIRLSQIQDIAGCRVIVSGVLEQDRVVDSLCKVFPETSVIDRRAEPSYGYQAVHVIAKISGKQVEIQVRTELQHLWAEFSEKLSDKVDPSIKYGCGPLVHQMLLAKASDVVASIEKAEREPDPDKVQGILSLKKDVAEILKTATINAEKTKRVEQ
jgi:GTP pyrophosphokinase